jgi:glucokinase
VVVGVDVGGTKTLALLVAVDADGTPVVVDREQVPSDANSPEVVGSIVDALGAVLARASTPVERVGVGLAGLVDLTGVVRRAPNSAGLNDVDVVGAVSAAVGLPVVTDNDANCVAVAARALLAPDAQHLVAVTLGTGIGGGLVVDGQLVRGAMGFAGEPGHMVVDRNGVPCPCGQRGCWERYASGTALGRLGREAAEAGRGTSLVAAAGFPPPGGRRAGQPGLDRSAGQCPGHAAGGAGAGADTGRRRAAPLALAGPGRQRRPAGHRPRRGLRKAAP